MLFNLHLKNEGSKVNSNSPIVIGYLLAILLAFLPPIFSDDLFNTTQTATFVFFNFMLLLIIAAILIRLCSATVIMGRINGIESLLIVLVIYITTNRYLFSKGYGFSLIYDELLALMILYIVLRNFEKINIYNFIFIAIIVGGIIQAIQGNLELYGYLKSNNDNFKITGNFFNPGPYAGYLASVFPIALGCYIFGDKIMPQPSATANIFSPLRRLFYILPLVGIVCILLILPATQSRAAWVGVICSSLFICWHRYNLNIFFKAYFNTAFKNNLLLLLIGCILIFAALFLYFIKKDSSNGRIFIWKTTLNMIKDHPFTGVGIDRFKANYMDYQSNYFLHNPKSNYIKLADNVTFAFNEPLQFAAEEGIIGVLLGIIIVVIFIKTINLKSPLSIIALGGIISVTVFSFFSYPTAILSIKLNAVCYLVILIREGRSDIVYQATILNKSPYFIFIKGLSVVALFSICILGYQYTRKNFCGFKNWQTANIQYQHNDDNAISTYKKAYPLFRNNGEFLLAYGVALIMTNEHKTAAAVLQRSAYHANNTSVQLALGDCYKAIGIVKKAEAAYRSAYFMCPNRFYPQYLLAKLYLDTHQNKKAYIIAKEILSKTIKVESPAINDIIQEMELVVKANTISK